MRVLILVTHLLGVGHLARAAAIGRAFARAGHGVALVSGGRAAPAVSLQGIDLVQLPALHARGTDFKTLYDDAGAVATEPFFAARRAVLRQSIRDAAPEAAIVELYPFGRRQLSQEFEAALAELRALAKPCPVFCSVRDVLAPPSKASRADETLERLGAAFDGVLVHSDPDILPLEASWPVTPALRRQLLYTGYVRDGAPVTPEVRGDEVVVSGGGSAASLPLLVAACDAARQDAGRPWRILAGHGVAEPDFAALQAAAPPNAVVERARPDFRRLLARAACSVSQFGYNTAVDLVETGTPAVVIPFSGGREVEQTIRAERFAALGRVEIVPEATLTPPSLLAAVARAMAGPQAAAPIDLSGAQTSVRLVEAAAADAQATAAAWRRAEAALDAAFAQGRRLPFWWRDDDAVAPTPELDRLLALRARLAIPLALAVIPERATPALAARLAGEADVAVLVHGVQHTNNACAPAKKQELVTADAAACAALVAGRERLAGLFGAAALPVLVPPWNRIAPALVAFLPALGFAGLSTFAGSSHAVPAGLVVVDAHLDPIDWKGGGGPVGAPAHIARLADLIESAGAASGGAGAAIGVLTHHLQHDPWVWRQVEAMLSRLAGHPGAEFVSAGACFGLTGAAGRAPKE